MTKINLFDFRGILVYSKGTNFVADKVETKILDFVKKYLE